MSIPAGMMLWLILSSPQEASLHHQVLLQDAFELINTMEEIKITFVYREMNGVADHLAKEGRKRTFGKEAPVFNSQHFIWDSPPSWINVLLNLDKFPFFRTVSVVNSP